MIEKIDEYKNTIVLHLRGELGINSKGDYVNIFNEHIEKKPEFICLDCSNLTSIDSVGLGILVSFSKIALKNEAQLIICDLSEKVASIFDISQLDKYFKIMPWKEFEEDHLL